ncbi:inner membrane protein YiaA [Stenotrophomonas sp. Iso1]|uniref:inner membrane protein YiaA n=1 Tax=Stenotrophomonas sp. Iso1 TaxID=2977283 RepID=UPI0022B790B8|nr:inner membrane protein YiaA [Stenotrophomonas sp. Iso1]
MNKHANRPSAAFIAASWCGLLLGAASYLIGLFNAGMQLNEKGYYLALLLFGLFAAVSLQKSVRDRVEGVAVSGLYYSLAWFALLSALLLLVVGLWNATLMLSEKGFYGMAYALALFGAVAVQKNTRDLMAADAAYGEAPLPALPSQE